MKNPMDRKLDKRLSDRAVEIGREGEVDAFEELLKLLQSSSANVRRLSASALGKLAWMGVDQPRAVTALATIARDDPHAQTRQYAIKMSMYKKQTLYQQEGKRLISVYPKDLPNLDHLLTTKLRIFGFVT